MRVNLPFSRRGLATKPSVCLKSYSTKSRLLRTVDIMITLRSCGAWLTFRQTCCRASHLALKFFHAPDFYAISKGLQSLANLQALSMVGSYDTDVVVTCSANVRSRRIVGSVEAHRPMRNIVSVRNNSTYRFTCKSSKTLKNDGDFASRSSLPGVA